MNWLELSVQVPWEYVEPVSYLFNRHGRGFSIEEPQAEHVLLRTYLSSNAKRKLAQIDVGVRLVSLLVPGVELVVSEIKREDWETSWKAHFSLFRVGERLVIRPSWVEYEAQPGELVITLDPGMAFGTGYHPTTRMCLAALERLVPSGAAVLDLGTGSGILSVAACLLGASSALGIDTDSIAVKVARDNCRTNGLARTVRLVRGSLPLEQAPAGSFDIAVANISGRVIQDKASAARDALKHRGTLIASGFVRHQAGEVADRLRDTGYVGVEVDYLDEWACIVARRG